MENAKYAFFWRNFMKIHHFEEHSPCLLVRGALSLREAVGGSLATMLVSSDSSRPADSDEVTFTAKQPFRRPQNKLRKRHVLIE